EARHGGLCLPILRLDLRALELRYRAALVPRLEQRERPQMVLCGGARDLELAITGAERDIGRRHRRDHREHHAAAPLLARIDLRLRQLGLPAHAAEEVDLPGRAERRIVERMVALGARRQRHRAVLAGAVAARLAAVAELRVELRARGAQRA